MNWYLAENGEQIGPFSDEDVSRRLAAGTAHPETLAWREGLEGWQALRALFPQLFGQPEPMVICAVSGASGPRGEMLQFGDQWVLP